MTVCLFLLWRQSINTYMFISSVVNEIILNILCISIELTLII